MKYYSAFELLAILSKFCEVVLDFNLDVKVKYVVACDEEKIVILNAYEHFSEEEVEKLIKFISS